MRRLNGWLLEILMAAGVAIVERRIRRAFARNRDPGHHET